VRHTLEAFLRHQRDAGFPDLLGTHAAATIPVADRLLNDLIASLLPHDGTVRGVVLHARDGNEIEAEFLVAKGPMSLPMRVILEIESQPALPQRPVLGLRLKTAPLLLTLGGPILRMFGVLPSGVSVDGDRIYVNFETLLARYSAAALMLRHLTELRVTTNRGVVVLSVAGGIGPN
jgi:hypothetical protein